MFKVVLHNPQIPPNTGNLIRLCANTGFELHLVKPLGFSLDEKAVRRAGLDYREAALVKVHDSIDDCLLTVMQNGAHVYACSTKGTVSYEAPNYKPGDVLMLGSETAGLPPDVLCRKEIQSIIRIPMKANSRSLNLSNAAAIIAFEAWRQNGFADEAKNGNEELM